MVDCFGNLSISAYCTREIKNKNIIGNVSDGKVLRDLIEEWNYRVPLTCKEACDMETYKMHLEKNRLDDIDLKDDVKDIYNGNICGYIFMENYRKLLHKKVTCLTPEEIEKVSILALNLEIKKENNLLLEEELRVENEKIDDCIGKMILEHYYDDVHEEFPHLTHEECIEMKDSITYCKENEGKFTILPYLLKANQLMKLNRYRSTQIKDIFEDEK